MVIHQQIRNNESPLEEYQTHSERKKSGNVKKISVKVSPKNDQVKSGRSYGPVMHTTISAQNPLLLRPSILNSFDSKIFPRLE